MWNTSLVTPHHADGAASVEDEHFGFIARLSAAVADLHRRVAPQILGYMRPVHRGTVRLPRRRRQHTLLSPVVIGLLLRHTVLLVRLRRCRLRRNTGILTYTHTHI